MRLKFGNYIMNMDKLEDEELILSPLYDRQLHNFSHSISVRGKSLQSFTKTLENSKEGGILSLDNNDNVLKEYKVTSNSYSYQGNNPNEDTIYNYNLHFEEVVNVQVEALQISGLSIKPYKYSHEYDNGIIVTVSVNLTKDDYDKFKKIQDGDRYFSVVRQGISEKVISMRFGRVIWSEHEDFIKVNLVLVEECYDTNATNKGLLEPEKSNIMSMLAFQKNLNNELIKILIDKEVVSQSEIDFIKDKAKNDLKETQKLYYKVEDVDEFEE